MNARLTDVLAVLVAAGLAWVVVPAGIVWWQVGIVLAAYAAAPLFKLRGPGGSDLDLVLLIGAAVPFVFVEPAGTVAVVVAGLGVVRGVRMAGLADPVALGVDVRRATGALAYAGVLGLGGVTDGAHSGVGPVLVFAAAALAWVLVEVFFRLIGLSRARTAGFAYLVGVGVKDLPLIGSLIAGGAAFGLVWQQTPWVALVVGSVPFLITFSSFRRYDDARRTYGQTILALARIPEVGGLALDGHADRTGRLAVAIGKEMGLRPDRVQTLEYAARMHDIGRITLTEPSIVERGYTADDIARWSSEIIAEADYLAAAADIVRVHHLPYRRPGEEDDPGLPLEARIVKAASAFDRAVHEAGVSPVEALEALHLGTSYDYDPAVIRSLRAVLTADATLAGTR